MGQVRRSEIWLNCWAYRAVSSVTVSSWRPVTTQYSSGRPFLGPGLFNIFVGDQGDGTKCTRSEFADKTTPGAVPGAPAGCAAWRNVPRAVQPRERPSPAPGWEQPQAPVKAGGPPAGKQLGRKGPDGQQAEREPAMRPSAASRPREVILPLSAVLVRHVGGRKRGMNWSRSSKRPQKMMKDSQTASPVI